MKPKKSAKITTEEFLNMGSKSKLKNLNTKKIKKILEEEYMVD
jgi:hypothetical protein